MDKTRGIVMKTSKTNTILYTERGDYLEIKTPKATPLLGQVIELDLPVRKPLSHRFLKLGSIAVMLLLALGLGVFNIVSNANTAVAAVVMDINNSKELFVNHDAKVLKVVDLTHGSKNSSVDPQLQGKDIYTAVSLMIDQANTQGILKKSKNLIMTSIIPMDKREVDAVDQAKLRDSIGRHMLEKNISADLMVIRTDETTQKTAQSLGMSVNHYLVYKRLMDNGFDPNSSSSNDTSHMLTEASTTISSLFPQESMIIIPQSGTKQELPNSMGNPMAGERMPSNSSPGTGSSQNQSPPTMTNTLPPSNHTMPADPPMGSAPSVPMPMQNGSGSSSSSGKRNMMR